MNIVIDIYIILFVSYLDITSYMKKVDQVTEPLIKEQQSNTGISEHERIVTNVGIVIAGTLYNKNE